MSNDASQNSHLSQRRGNPEKVPLKQHHRLATGEKVSGTSNPYGAAKGSTTDKIANGKPGNY